MTAAKAGFSPTAGTPRSWCHARFMPAAHRASAPIRYVLAGQNSVKTRAHFWLFQFYDYVYPPSPDFPNELGEPNLKPNL